MIVACLNPLEPKIELTLPVRCKALADVLDDARKHYLELTGLRIGVLVSPQSEGVLLVRAGFADAALEGGTVVAGLLVTVHESDEIAAWLLVFGLVHGTSFGCSGGSVTEIGYDSNTSAYG